MRRDQTQSTQNREKEKKSKDGNELNVLDHETSETFQYQAIYIF